MSHFYATIQGSRGEATRTGTRNSGMSAHIRGWNIGVRVELDYDEEEGDVVKIFLTGGSNSPSGEQLIEISERERTFVKAI